MRIMAKNGLIASQVAVIQRFFLLVAPRILISKTDCPRRVVPISTCSIQT